MPPRALCLGPEPTLIKTMTLLRKSDSISRERFLQAWSDGAAGQLVDGIVRFVHQHILPPPPSTPGSTPLPLQVDAIEEVWFDTESALTAYRDLPTRRAFLADAVAAMTTFVVSEKTIADELASDASGDGLLKRLVLLVRKDGFSHEQFLRHWVEIHGPLAQLVVGGARRYSQIYVEGEVPNPPGLPTIGAEIDGLSDSWFDDGDHLARSIELPGGAELARDNKVYVKTSKQIYYNEVVIKA